MIGRRAFVLGTCSLVLVPSSALAAPKILDQSRKSMDADAVKVADADMKFTIRSWECGDLDRTSNKHSLVQVIHLPSSWRSSWL